MARLQQAAALAALALLGNVLLAAADTKPGCAGESIQVGASSVCYEEGAGDLGVLSMDGQTFDNTVQCACGDPACNCPAATDSNTRRLLLEEAAPGARRALQQTADDCVGTDVQQGNVPWGLDRINQRSLPLDDVYSYSTTGLGVNVYIVSTGIRATHSDFLGTDGKTRVRAAYSFDGSDPLTDRLGYGTQVAGVVGGKRFGVAKNATLHSVKVFASSPSTNLTEVLKAVNWVQKNAIKPAVVLWLTYGDVDPGKTAAVNGLNSAGIPVVVGSGSRGIDACKEGPANVPAANTVAGTSTEDAMNPAANNGSCVDLCAPGMNIPGPSSVSDDGVWTNTNTNNAPGHVAGAIARLLEASPGLNPANITQRLTSTATTGKLSGLRGTANRMLFTGGYAPICASFPSTANASSNVAISSPIAACSQPPTFNGTYPGRTLYLNFTVHFRYGIDPQSVSLASFNVSNPGSEVVNFTAIDPTNAVCGGYSVLVATPMDNAYLRNATTVCFAIPATGLVDGCEAPFPATSACFDVPNCPSGCMYATNMAYSPDGPQTTESTALITFAASSPVTGISEADFAVYGPATSSLSVVSQPDAPTFYFVVLELPATYYGKVTVAFTGTVADKAGDTLATPAPVVFYRIPDTTTTASTCVFELVPPSATS